MNEDEQAIRTLVERWLAASRAGDTAAVLGLMTDDVVFMVPGRAPFGKAAFAAAATEMQGVRMDGHSTIEEIQVLGDWAWLRSHVEVAVTPPGGTPLRRAGHTLTILRKGADGQWRLARDANLLTAVE